MNIFFAELRLKVSIIQVRRAYLETSGEINIYFLKIMKYVQVYQFIRIN